MDWKPKHEWRTLRLDECLDPSGIDYSWHSLVVSAEEADKELAEAEARLAASEKAYKSLDDMHMEKMHRIAELEKELVNLEDIRKLSRDCILSGERRITALEAALRQRCDECDHDTNPELCKHCDWYNINRPSGDGKELKWLDYQFDVTTTPAPETPEGVTPGGLPPIGDEKTQLEFGALLFHSSVSEDYIKQITIKRNDYGWDWFVENHLGGGNSGPAKSALGGLKCAVECISDFKSHVVSDIKCDKCQKPGADLQVDTFWFHKECWHTKTPAVKENGVTELIGWCKEHGRETVDKIIFGHFDSKSSGFTLFFKCGRRYWYKFPFLLDPVFTRPVKSSGDEHAGYGAQGEPVTPTTNVLGLETPASLSPEGKYDIERNPILFNNTEGEFTCDECGKHHDTIAVQLDFGFGSTRDEERFIFCSDECFTKWVHKEFDLPTMPLAPKPQLNKVPCGETYAHSCNGKRDPKMIGSCNPAECSIFNPEVKE